MHGGRNNHFGCDQASSATQVKLRGTAALVVEDELDAAQEHRKRRKLAASAPGVKLAQRNVQIARKALLVPQHLDGALNCAAVNVNRHGCQHRT